MASKKKNITEAKQPKSKYTKAWIIEHGIPAIKEQDQKITTRRLHYLLVAKGMPNDLQHYKKIISAMGDARWEGLLDFGAFVDYERQTIGKTSSEETNVEDEIESAKSSIRYWATHYSKNMWENQPIYPEVFIEKKTLQGVFEGTCDDWQVALNPCKGHPSITFLNDAKSRFRNAIRQDKKPVILYVGDYDCTGEDIPRSIVENLERMGVEVELIRIALMEHQVKAWKLPPAPTKKSDSRGAKWGGLGQVELEAVDSKKLVKLLNDGLEKLFDRDLHEELLAIEETETQHYKEVLLRDFKSLLD